jgi:hypothetical protein
LKARTSGVFGTRILAVWVGHGEMAAFERAGQVESRFDVELQMPLGSQSGIANAPHQLDPAE